MVGVVNMLIANHNGERVTATPDTQAHCEICGGTVRAKCGRIVIWHWAHETLEDCDPWAEPITQWHADWQTRFPTEYREVPVGDHRADILLPDGRVIEFQHSGISPDEIEAREAHYKNMVWVFDGVDAAQTGRLDLRITNWDAAPGLQHCSFRWRSPKRSVFFCRKVVFFDIGDNRLLHVRRIHPDPPTAGWGTIYPIDRFLSDCNVITALEIT